MTRQMVSKVGCLPLTMAAVMAWGSPAQASIVLGGTLNDEQTPIVYNAITGELGVDAPLSTNLTSTNIVSNAAIFAGDPLNLDGAFDTFSADNIFKATFGSDFGSLSFGFVTPPGLIAQFIANDFTVDGSLATGGGLGTVDLVYIPEPASLILLALGGGATILGRHRR